VDLDVQGIAFQAAIREMAAGNKGVEIGKRAGQGHIPGSVATNRHAAAAGSGKRAEVDMEGRQLSAADGVDVAERDPSDHDRSVDGSRVGPRRRHIRRGVDVAIQDKIVLRKAALEYVREREESGAA